MGERPMWDNQGEGAMISGKRPTWDQDNTNPEQAPDAVVNTEIVPDVSTGGSLAAFEKQMNIDVAAMEDAANPVRKNRIVGNNENLSNYNSNSNIEIFNEIAKSDEDKLNDSAYYNTNNIPPAPDAENNRRAA